MEMDHRTVSLAEQIFDRLENEILSGYYQRDELLTEMEHIISSGAKLNIDYYINENIDPEHQEELLDYWRNSESDSLEEAYEEFASDPDYTEEEIRLMRIKFMADFGH